MCAPLPVPTAMPADFWATFLMSLTLVSGLPLGFFRAGLTICAALEVDPEIVPGCVSQREGVWLLRERLTAFALKCFYINTQNTISVSHNLGLPSQLTSQHTGWLSPKGSREVAEHPEFSPL